MCLQSRNQSTADQNESELDSTSAYPTINSVSSAPNDSTYHSYQEDDYGADETFEESVVPGSTSTGYSSGRTYPCSVSAVYDFAANNGDELNMNENEVLEVIADGDGDGWVKVNKNQYPYVFILIDWLKGLFIMKNSKLHFN